MKSSPNMQPASDAAEDELTIGQLAARFGLAGLPSVIYVGNKDLLGKRLGPSAAPGGRYVTER